MSKKWVLKTVVGVMLLALVAQNYIGKVFAEKRLPVLFNYEFSDEFDGDGLDRGKWDVFEGNPVANGGWLTLSGANIQSKSVFGSGILQGVIQSSDWKPQNQFTDSSFGFEIWTGSNNQCHYGILFKASGHLAVLSPQPGIDGNCSGDPLYQAYPPVSNWDTIRAGSTVSFTLSWLPDSVTLKVSGNGQEGQASYIGQAIPTVPLKIRLYSQTNETYKIDYVRLITATKNERGHGVCLRPDWGGCN